MDADNELSERTKGIRCLTALGISVRASGVAWDLAAGHTLAEINSKHLGLRKVSKYAEQCVREVSEKLEYKGLPFKIRVRSTLKEHGIYVKQERYRRSHKRPEFAD